MHEIHCPKCKKLLMKAKLADIEIKCRGCGRIVEIKFYSQSQLLTAKKEVSTIKIQ